MGARGFWTFFTVVALAGLVAVSAAASSPARDAAAAGPTTLAATTTVATTTTAVATTTTTTLPPTTTTTTVFAPTDPRLTIFGDSVILGTQVVLPGALAGWDVTLEAAVSRFSHQLVPVVGAARSDLGEAAVVQIGNNYGGDQAGFGADLETVLAELDGLGRVVLLTVAEVRPDRVQVNEEIRAAAARHPNVVLVDWQGAVEAGAGGPAMTARDGLHLTKAGADALVGLLSQALGPPPAAP